MPPANDLSVDRIREIIDHAHTEYMSNLQPIDRPTEAELQEGESIFADTDNDK